MIVISTSFVACCPGKFYWSKIETVNYNLTNKKSALIFFFNIALLFTAIRFHNLKAKYLKIAYLFLHPDLIKEINISNMLTIFLQ